jgi:uncharacterized protein
MQLTPTSQISIYIRKTKNITRPCKNKNKMSAPTSQTKPQAETQPSQTKANPAPLGLMAFGLTTVLLNLHNSGLLGADSLGMILAMGIFYGGLAQVVAGIMEYKNKNTFGTTAFLSYGFFWLSLAAIMIMPKLGLCEPVSKAAMGAYLSMWGIFTALLFIGTLKLTRSLQVVFFTLVVLFFLLSIGDFTANPDITIIAGYVGLLCGFSAIYTGAGQLLNEVYKMKVFPL